MRICTKFTQVEAAFAYTSSVLTLSFHKYGNFFPGTGALKPEKGMQGVVNVPLKVRASR